MSNWIKGKTDPAQQAEDYHDAVTALQTLPGINPEEVGIWGVGHSGGAAMIAAASDPRLAAVILSMPFMSGAIDGKGFPPGTLDRAWAERVAKARGEINEPLYEQVWPTDREHAISMAEPKVFLAGEVPYNFITGGVERSSAAGTPWENKMTLQSFYHIARSEPHEYYLHACHRSRRSSRPMSASR